MSGSTVCVSRPPMRGKAVDARIPSPEIAQYGANSDTVRHEMGVRVHLSAMSLILWRPWPESNRRTGFAVAARSFLQLSREVDRVPGICTVSDTTSGVHCHSSYFGNCVLPLRTFAIDRSGCPLIKPFRRLIVTIPERLPF